MRKNKRLLMELYIQVWGGGGGDGGGGGSEIMVGMVVVMVVVAELRLVFVIGSIIFSTLCPAPSPLDIISPGIGPSPARHTCRPCPATLLLMTAR